MTVSVRRIDEALKDVGGFRGPLEKSKRLGEKRGQGKNL